jgi:predicted lipid-binding transport protein (Tim44 family)
VSLLGLLPGAPRISGFPLLFSEKHVKFLSSLAIVLALALSLVTVDAEAKRMGGGKSSGMQRQTTTQKAPDATPAQNPAGSAAAAAATAPKRSWMGPLAGLAAGLGLAALASHLGFGDELASMMMIGLAIMAVMVVIGIIMRKRAAARQPGIAGMQYAGAAAGAGGSGQVSKPYEASMPGSSIGSAIGSNLNQPTIPADFDVPGFVRNAKVQFIRLQAANDAGNLDDIRQFTTPEMFAELKMDIAEHVASEQQTEVVSVEADVIEVVQEPTQFVVSVRFSGLIREGKGTPAEPFDEMWHLVKARVGTQGWLLSGIQQTH